MTYVADGSVEFQLRLRVTIIFTEAQNYYKPGSRPHSEGFLHAAVEADLRCSDGPTIEYDHMVEVLITVTQVVFLQLEGGET